MVNIACGRVDGSGEERQFWFIFVAVWWVPFRAIHWKGRSEYDISADEMILLKENGYDGGKQYRNDQTKDRFNNIG